MAHAPKKARTASLHDQVYADLVQMVVERRKKSGLSQRAVAEALGWNQSIIAKIETVQRRMDLVEFVRISRVVGFDPTKIVKDIQAALRD